MRYFKVIVAVLALGLSGCLRSQQALNPPQLVTARDTDMAIQLFMQATILLSRYYGFETLEYAELRDRSVRHGYDMLPFMPPISTRATPAFVHSKLRSSLDYKEKEGDSKTLERMTRAEFRTWANTVATQNGTNAHRMLITYYVQTGWRASQIICRNYMLGLDERNQYLEFLQKEFNIGAGLANAILILSNANPTLRSIFYGSTVATNLAIDEYQDFRFLTIVDRDAARALVEAAQNKYAMTFLEKVQGMRVLPVTPGGDIFPAVATQPNPGFVLFSDAIQVVNTIEYQCTRSGIRGLLNKAIGKSPEKLQIDPSSNAVFFN